jgi:hypothetical protein
MDWLLGGEVWPADQLPPATGPPTPAAARRASATCQTGVVGLRVPLGHPLLGQDPAQPGMLVVHRSFPSDSQLLPYR